MIIRKLTARSVGRMRADLTMGFVNRWARTDWQDWRVTFLSFVSLPTTAIQMRSADGVWRAAYLDTVEGEPILRLADEAAAIQNGWTTWLYPSGFRTVAVRAAGSIDVETGAQGPQSPHVISFPPDW